MMKVNNYNNLYYNNYMQNNFESNKYRKIAVLLIDMQNVFVNHLRCGAKEKIIPKQIEIIRKYAKNNIPVYVIELSNTDFPKDIMSLNPQISKELEKFKNKILIVKNKDNAFTDTDLEKLLSEQKITHLLLMGVNAQGCVLETAKTAIEKGFKIMTAATLIAGQPTDIEDDCAPWFTENGLFFPKEIDDLLKILH